MKKIAFYEPWFFLLFGVFHLHRIWGMIDRKSYADFWIGIWESRNAFYYVLMIILAMVCLLGIISFFKNIHHNYWWRWIYVAGGSYLLFDLFAIFARLKFWNEPKYKHKSWIEAERLQINVIVKSDKRSDLH